MTQEEITQKLTAIFREVFEDDTIVITDKMVANDVENWDSLSNVLMINKVEQSFNIKLKLKEVINLQNVGDLIKSINMHLQA